MSVQVQRDTMGCGCNMPVRDFRRGAKQPIEFVFARELPDLYGTLDHLAWPSICGSPSKAVIAYTSR
jgi:hypothetical protein